MWNITSVVTLLFDIKLPAPYNNTTMMKLLFSESMWDRVLPCELVAQKRHIREGDETKWKDIPILYWPSILTTSREKYWIAIKNGKDTRDILTFASGKEIHLLTKFIERDPAGLYALVSVPIDFAEEISRFTYKVLEEMSGVLDEANVQDGKINAGIISAKSRAYSNLKGCMDGLLKLRDLGAGTGMRAGSLHAITGGGNFNNSKNYGKNIPGGIAPIPDFPESKIKDENTMIKEAVLAQVITPKDSVVTNTNVAGNTSATIDNKLDKDQKDNLDVQYEQVMEHIKNL